MSLEGANKKTPKFTLRGLQCKAKVVKCYDGDTCQVVFPFHGELTRWTVRLYGINTPEVTRCSNEEKIKGIKARDFVSNLILDKEVWIKCYDWGKYGRLIADIYFTPDFTGATLSNIIIENNHSKQYMRTEDGKTQSDDSITLTKVGFT